ncbi:hypothetical protein MAMC_01790 [Methylacidimicrobium cyclopophantes]|uniref:Lipoprotein n=2 Tax=Methylacidimicrobium cyclopophantes TaxID=1041766 RepID=A0A5E6MHH9_9BACT|nr:hypothetical protein MAMC_01790 [Methylacidimicrobium cyclopophantes]
MIGMPTVRRKKWLFPASVGSLLLAGFVLLSAWAQAAPRPSSPDSAASPAPRELSLEEQVRALIAKDLYPGEKIEALTVIPEPEQSRIAARWEAHILDDGKHFHPLFHPPSIILYEVLPGQAHFPALGSALAPNAASAPEFQVWQKKLALTRNLMRQVVVLRCMLYCRHQMDALDQENLHGAERELETLTAKPSQR